MKADIQTQVNVLPISSKSWLQFYDQLSADNKQLPVLSIAVTDDYGNYFSYRIERDFYLARVAEALLASRYTRLDLTVLQQVLEGARHTDSLIPSPSDFLEQLWRVAMK